MNRFRTICYGLKDGFYNLRRGGITGIVSIITIAFTLLNIGLFLMLWRNASPFFTKWMKDLKVVGYLKDPVSEKRIVDIKKELGALENVKEVLYVDKKDALQRFRDILGDDASLLDGLDENPLPASLEIVIKDGARLTDIDEIIKNLKEREEFEEIQSGRQWLHRLSSLFVIIKIIGLSIGGVLIFISLFIISNTVRLTLINRKEEVEIMRLVGAHKWFIQMPFLIEGTLNGLLGGVLSISLLYILYYFLRFKLSPYLLSTFGVLGISFIPLSSIILLLGLGMVVGGLGSIFSIKI